MEREAYNTGQNVYVPAPQVQYIKQIIVTLIWDTIKQYLIIYY